MIASIAWRNIWRNKLRSFIIMASIFVGIIGATMIKGFSVGLADQRAQSSISNRISNIQIHHPKFLLNQEIQYSISEPAQIIDKIKAIDGVKGVSLRIETNAMAASASTGTGVSLYGVLPDDERQTSGLHRMIKAGEYLKDEQRLPVVAGEKLLKKLNLTLNDKLIVTLADSTGTITSGAFNIVGVYKTDDQNFDVSHIYVKRQDLAALTGYSPEAGNEIAILLADNKATSSITAKLNKLFQKEIEQKEILVQSWEQIEPLTKSMIKMMNYFSYFFLIIILAALSFVIVNTMLMAVMERTREIGTLMALGMNKPKIFSMILLESVYLSTIGGIIGTATSILMVQYYAIKGFDLSSAATALNYFGYDSIIYFKVNPLFYITSLVLVVFIALLSGIYPALRALKLQPVAAIRDED